MSLLIETIRVYNGAMSNLAFHEARMRQACGEVLGMKVPWDLGMQLTKTPIPPKGLFKCRVVYDEDSVSFSFLPYEPRPVSSLKIIHDNSIGYEHKFADRSRLDAHFQNRGSCDDILVIKDGKVTDSSNANIVFIQGAKWFTPKNCLLNGTMRQSLILTGRLHECEIGVGDVSKFESFKLINAMIQDQSPVVPTNQIFP